MKVMIWIASDSLDALYREQYTEVIYWLQEPGSHAGSVVQVSIDYDSFIRLSDLI